MEDFAVVEDEYRQRLRSAQSKAEVEFVEHVLRKKPWGRSYWGDVWVTMHWARATIFTAWVLIGSFAAPVVYVDRLALSLVAMFLYLVVASYALDEWRGRHCGTRLSKKHLKARVYGGLAGATAIGLYLSFTVSLILFPLALVGIVLLVGYNWEILGGWVRRATFGISWGAYPMLAHYYLQALEMPPWWLWVLAAGAAVYSFHHVGIYGNTGCRVAPLCRDLQERDRLHPGQGDWLCHGQKCSVRRWLLSPEAGEFGLEVHRKQKRLALHETYFAALLATAFIAARLLV